MCCLLTQGEQLPVWLWKVFTLNLLIPLQDRSCWVSSWRGKMGPTSPRQICFCFPKRSFFTDELPESSKLVSWQLWCAVDTDVQKLRFSWFIWWYLQTYINTVFQIRSEIPLGGNLPVVTTHHALPCEVPKLDIIWTRTESGTWLYPGILIIGEVWTLLYFSLLKCFSWVLRWCSY